MTKRAPSHVRWPGTIVPVDAMSESCATGEGTGSAGFHACAAFGGGAFEGVVDSGFGLEQPVVIAHARAAAIGAADRRVIRGSGRCATVYPVYPGLVVHDQTPRGRAWSTI